MQTKKDMKITIPEGNFEGDCDSCFYAKKKKRDYEGRILCVGSPGGYHFSYDKVGCKHYVSKIIQWIKILVASYFIIAVLVGIVQLLFF